MKLTSTAVAVLTVLSLASCRPKEQGPQEQHAQSRQPRDAGGRVRTGTVQEVIQANAYTYLNVKDEDGLFWVAITKREMTVGEAVSFADALEMKNFTSKDLQRTFETIYFVSELSTGPLSAPTDTPGGASPHARAAIERLEISVERAEGGITIGELFSDRQSYADKTVRVRGQVTKVNRAIMGKNWVHLQDGTGDPEHYDLTITTQNDAVAGEVVTFEGTIVLNKDFGSGYAYEVLVQDAKRRGE